MEDRERILQVEREAELAEIKAEKEKQAREGKISNAAKIGKFKYHMKKTDFQTENELTGNLRTIKPMGIDHLLHENYDSVFRRNLLEPEAPEGTDKKR